MVFIIPSLSRRIVYELRSVPPRFILRWKTGGICSIKKSDSVYIIRKQVLTNYGKITLADARFVVVVGSRIKYTDPLKFFTSKIGHTPECS